MAGDPASPGPGDFPVSAALGHGLGDPVTGGQLSGGRGPEPAGWPACGGGRGPGPAAGRRGRLGTRPRPWRDPHARPAPRRSGGGRTAWRGGRAPGRAAWRRGRRGTPPQPPCDPRARPYRRRSGGGWTAWRGGRDPEPAAGGPSFFRRPRQSGNRPSSRHYASQRRGHTVPHARSYQAGIPFIHGRNQMTPQDPSLDPLLEQAIAEIRGEAIDPAVIEAAAGRVQARLAQHHTLHTCADFQALIPDYRADKLSAARALLLKDHTHECVACYKALKANPPATSHQPPATKPYRAWSTIPAFRWAVAATVVAAAGLAFWAFGDRLRPAFSGPEAVVESADGLIYRVSDTGTLPLIRGAEVPAGVDIRTARDSRAILRLRDGSHVEMRERSGLSVSERGHDMAIGLDRGAIIVQAAKRHTGHLYVSTRDCRVAVTGTVFSVNSGLKGSRVTVIEGTVLVAQDRHESVLHAGGQVSTSSAMGATPVPLEISWSKNADAYIAMLNAVTALNVKLDQDHFPALRYSSNLLTMVPAQTVVYASIPNLSQALTEVQQVFVPKIQQNATLSQWWQQNKLDQVIADMSTMSGYLGNEMVVAASLNSSGHPGQPVIMAELKQPGFETFAQAEVAKLSSGANAQKMRIVTDPSAIGAIPQGQCVLLILSDRMIILFS